MDSGRIPFNPTTFSVSELMEDIHLSMHDMVLQKGLQFHNLAEKNNFTVVADHEKIRQVITGLIGNAIKFTHSGSISFGYNIIKTGVEFFVRDTGIGIPVDEQSKIFERFYQVPQKLPGPTRGTGLGLSIAIGLAEIMNGTLRVESLPGKGSVFYMTVPCEETTRSQPADEPGKPFSGGSLTLLVAEDEDFNFELLEVMLGKRVKKILRAVNGKEVISLLLMKKPDLVLMDLKMPVMDGYEATRRAKALYPDLQIIALTAYTQPEEERRALEAGCSAFISKPVRSQELMETIRRCLRN
jgi:CheY-like chemotaxis protein